MRNLSGVSGPGALRHVDIPAESGSRSSRFEALQAERDVLRHLLDSAQGAFILWDPDGRMIWVSQRASSYLDAGPLSDELRRAALTAREQLTQSSRRPLGAPSPGWVCQIQPRHGARVDVKFWYVRRGDRCLWLVASLATGQRGAASFVSLTPAENRVLCFLGRGSSNKEISEELQVSRETVKTHVARILRKLGVDSRAKAGSLARTIDEMPRAMSRDDGVA